MKKINHLAAVITCHDYSDFLAETLPHNIPSLDDVVVVTGYGDKRTQQVCKELNVRCVPTDLFHRNGERFRKASGINLGLAHLDSRDWILHMDADIALPREFRQQVEREHLDRDCLYGCDRVHVTGYRAWDEHLASGHRQHNSHNFVEVPHHFALGARVVHAKWGYVPIGFFQLWHLSQKKTYPDNTPSAERTDMTFAMQWAEPHRRKLVGVVAYHLDSIQSAPVGANWHGRKTPPFRPVHHHHNRDLQSGCGYTA